MMAVRGKDGRFYYILKEFSYDAFDKSGRMSIWKLSKVFEGLRASVNLHILPRHVFGKILLFVRAQQFTIYPKFYTKITQNRAVNLVTSHSHIGRTSFSAVEELVDVLTDEVLAQGRYHCVVVSAETRRPIPVPSEIANSIQVIQPSDGEHPLRDPKFVEKLPKCFSNARTVMPSDTDPNKHLNASDYLRYGFDCVSMAAVNGTLSAFRDDMAYSNTKQVWIRYLSEAVVGEEIRTSCWEDGNNPHLIWVEFTKGSEVICQCHFEYYKENMKITQEPLPSPKL
ncbi:uncharacterized protein LOC117288243 [Asterias rubens]|uniref:uncharacterized protein LOC117288243 n=1 Tax=Asterias rubens TaxID=7604 RepID=UPI001455C533|nr:uncharacterized protein LOC117288243 [Asterias rubens]XP_033624913.1 uncharacterized protein LOC117288243 [Asterias rubens]